MNEISGAIISITLVMAAVFIPVTFVTGPTGVFYEQFGVTLIIAILISAVNALTLSPALCALLLKPHKEDEEISLTQKEFALLEHLLRNKGMVCRRSRIIESVWDIHFDYNTGVIDVFINALRKKLKLGKDENYIQTVRGVGYIAKEL